MAENDIVEDGGYYVIIKLGKGFYWNTAKTKKEKQSQPFSGDMGYEYFKKTAVDKKIRFLQALHGFLINAVKGGLQ